MNPRRYFYKIVISIGFLLAVLSVSYYFVIFLPQKQKSEIVLKESKELLERTAACRRDGLELDIKYEPDEDSGGILLNSRYKYDEKRKKCFYSGGYFNFGITTKYVVDVFTNEDIAFYSEGDKGVISGDKRIFEQVHEELFGN